MPITPAIESVSQRWQRFFRAPPPRSLPPERSTTRANPADRINVAHVYLVKGPDAVSGKTVRQLVFAPADIGAKLKACATLSCVGGLLNEA
jgi:hypothetical protein